MKWLGRCKSRWFWLHGHGELQKTVEVKQYNLGVQLQNCTDLGDAEVGLYCAHRTSRMPVNPFLVFGENEVR